MASQDSATYDPTYREQEVDSTLQDHDVRISRLEKVALIGIGYGIAEGSNIVTDIAQFI